MLFQYRCTSISKTQLTHAWIALCCAMPHINLLLNSICILKIYYSTKLRHDCDFTAAALSLSILLYFILMLSKKSPCLISSCNIKSNLHCNFFCICISYIERHFWGKDLVLCFCQTHTSAFKSDLDLISFAGLARKLQGQITASGIELGREVQMRLNVI